MVGSGGTSSLQIVQLGVAWLADVTEEASAFPDYSEVFELVDGYSKEEEKAIKKANKKLREAHNRSKRRLRKEQQPIEMLNHLMKGFARNRDIQPVPLVIDPFAGTGTTGPIFLL